MKQQQQQQQQLGNNSYHGLSNRSIYGTTAAGTTATTTPPTATTTTTTTTTTASNSRYSSKPYDDDDVTQELLAAHRTAASVPDEFGKVPFVLAVESGKPWKTTLKPLWDAHDLEDESYQLLQEAIDQALTSSTTSIRKQTVQTLEHLAPLWPKDKREGFLHHMIGFARDCGGLNANNASTTGGAVTAATTAHSKKLLRDDDEACAALQASTLEGLASVMTVDESESGPHQALDVALPLLSHTDEAVRVSAAKVLGVSVRLLGQDAADRAFRDVVFPEDESGSSQDEESLSTMGHSVAMNEDTPEVMHGRAMACRYILSKSQRVIVLNEYQVGCVKQWMKHESSLVRKASCLVVGSLLRSVIELKEFKSPLLKCMRPMEDPGVQMALAQALSQAARAYDNLFLCKAGLPLLDGALMVASSRATPPHVQQAFHLFLWHALQRQEGGLREYMKMAAGENGTIMMSLITKRLVKLPVVDEGDEQKG